MITVAVANLLESSHQALEFIYKTSKMKGLKVQSISPEANIIYMHNKRMTLKQYIQTIEKEKRYDLLVIELSKEAIRKQIYENLNFHIVVLFDNEICERKNKLKRVHVTNHLLGGMKSRYYVLPDKYRDKVASGITYGWSKGAHISVTSAQTNVEGQMEVQCCVGGTIRTMNGSQTLLKEFGVESSLNNIEGVLARIATLVIYGIDLGER